MGGSENSVGRCFPDHADAGVWECVHPAGGVYCRAADGRGVVKPPKDAKRGRGRLTEKREPVKKLVGHKAPGTLA